MVRKYKRLKFGEFLSMSPEQQREHKRMLQRRWRKNNKDIVKARNHRYYLKYKKIKPYVVVCKYCGEEFHATRNYYKICPDCLKKPKTIALKKMEIQNRKAKKEEMKKEIRNWYSAGMTQMALAQYYGVTQTTISKWLKQKKS